MITARRLQRGFADGFIAEAVEDLWACGHTARRYLLFRILFIHEFS